MSQIKNRLRIALVVFSGVIATAPYAHPYDSPLEFRAHKTNDGRIIYSNIPKKCFNDGVLNCYQLHPIFPKTGAPAPSTAPQISGPSEPE
jgi:hypothetical protein